MSRFKDKICQKRIKIISDTQTFCSDAIKRQIASSELRGPDEYLGRQESSLFIKSVFHLRTVDMQRES